MRSWSVVVLPLLLASCVKSTPSPMGAADLLSAVQLTKPPLDDREYRLVQLDNGLRALLISDDDTDMAAAALDVHVGQFSDPADREGLAHFLEHMLFMGTDKYPSVDGYRDFVQAHGGGTNASTSQEHTRYHFDIEHPYLEEALDRFSRFFVAPTLDPEYVTREREAVNSEYSLKVQDEARRYREVRRATANPAHGFAKFSVGNLDTLADRDGAPVWDSLRAFYDAEYSASRMTLSVIGRQDLDTLEAWVRSRFSEVPTTGEGPPSSGVDPYLPEQLGARVNITPLNDIRRVDLEFLVPSELPHFAEHPLGLLSALLGQEGEGSPHALLSERGWITSLRSGSSGAEDHGLLTVQLELTEEGFAHVDDAVGVLFQYVRVLQDAEDLSPWWEEQRSLRSLDFQFAEPPSPTSAVQRASSALPLYPPEHVLDFWATFSAYDAELERTYLDRLTPDNARVLVTGPGLETDQVEPRYDVPWSILPLDPAVMKQWSTSPIDPALRLPDTNPYVAEAIALKPVQGEVGVPTHHVDEPGLSVWHLQDPSFEVPRSTVRVTLALPAATGSMQAKVNALLFTDLVDDALSPMRDQLGSAGLNPSFGTSADGLRLTVRGYDDKQQEVVSAYLDAALAQRIDPDRFAVLRDNLVRQWRNLKKSRSVNQVGWALAEALDPADWDYQSGADHLESLTPETLEAWRTDLFANAAVEVVVHGNHTAAEAEAIGRSVTAKLADAGSADRRAAQVRRIPDGATVVRDVVVEHADSAIRVLYQGADTELSTQATWLMLGNLIKTPAFTQLRTEQQLGYIVWGGYDRRDRVAGLGLGIQSSVAEPTELLERIDAFLLGYGDTLDAMSDEEFETVKAGLVATLEESPTDLYDRTRDLFTDLDLGLTTFDRKARLVELLRPMTKASVAELLRDEVLGDSAARLVVRALGRAHADTPLDPTGCADTACVTATLTETFDRAR
ncbi:MAG: insulysin [Myxococcota bacterium]